MQPGCPPCSECSAGLTLTGLRGDMVLTTRRVGYLETRRAPTTAAASGAPEAGGAPEGAGAALRRCCTSCCLPRGCRPTAAVTPASPDAPYDDTPITTVTTVTPCTPPPGALPEPEPQPGDGDGDRAFLDFAARESRCGARCASSCLPRSPCRARCVPSSDRVSGLRELEGRCCTVLAIVTFMGMVVGLAIFSDPLLLDLSTRLQRARCLTINYSIPLGATNCTWASCRESCTTQAFKCPQIYVNYTLVSESEADAGDYEDAADNTTAGGAGQPAPSPGRRGQGTVPLQVNVAGCGLDAVKYSCTKFHGEYMAVGHEFECDVAVEGPWHVAVPVAVRAQGAGGVPAWLGGFLPLVLCVACILYMRARRLFSADVVAAAGPKIKRFSLRPKGSEPRSFYKRKMAEMDEWRQRRRQLVLTGAGRGSAASRVHADDSDGLMSSDDQDEDDDLEDVVVGTVCIEPRPQGLYEDDEDDDDDDVAVEMELPPTPPESPEPPPPPPHKLPPPPPPCSPETSPPPTPDLAPLIVLPDCSSGASRGARPLGPIAEEPQVAVSPRPLERGGSARSQRSGTSASWRGRRGEQSPLRTVSGAVQADQSYDISP